MPVDPASWGNIARTFGRFGIPGLGLFVFLLLFFNTFDFSFGAISPTWSAVIAILFLLVVTVVTIYSLSYGRERRTTSALHDYEIVKNDAGSAEANVAAIERIAKSDDPHKEVHLQQLMSISELSWAEKHAIHEALVSLREGRKVEGLFKLVRDREWNKIEQMYDSPTTEREAKLILALKGLKYWRYVNRRNHADFAKAEHALAYGHTGGLSDEQIYKVLGQITSSS